MSWRTDFNWSWKGVIYKETGAEIRFSKALFYDIYRWAVYTAAEKCRNLWPGGRVRVVCYPNNIRPWYLLWGIIVQAGGKLTSAKKKTRKTTGDEIAIHFLDHTVTKPEKPTGFARTLNFDCTDISKTHVSAVFEQVFGYNLMVDPARFSGKMVVKSEENGAHDGRIVEGPTKPEKGFVYQKVIDNRSADKHVADLRCPTLFGRPTLVFIKERPEAQRFENLNTKCRIADPKDLFSELELEKILHFCQKMNLDFGGLDILRDAEDGRIYIVDVNKTDMGPPLALPLREKLRATDMIAKQFKAAVFGAKEE